MSIQIRFEAHCTTFDNEAKRASGWNDVALSPLGLKQAEELGERNKGKEYAAVFCSDLQRSYKTAEIAFDGTDIPIIKDKRLRECDYGQLTQHPSKEIESEKPKRIDTPFPGGESYRDTVKRMESFLSDLRKNYAGKSILIIGHRATQYGLDHLIKNIPLETVVTTPFTWQPGWEYEMGEVVGMDETERKMRADLSKRVKKVCCPVFIESNFLGKGHSDKNPNGTMTFIKYKKAMYCCTCKHVVDVAVNESGEKPKSMQIHANRMIFNIHAPLVRPNKKGAEEFIYYPAFKVVPEKDIAIREIPYEWYSSILAPKKDLEYIDLDNYKEIDCSSINIVHAFGWLSEHKKILDNQVLVELADVTVGLDFDVRSDILTLHSELSQKHGFFFSGMSGGPVLYHNDGNGEITFIGLIFEGSPSSSRANKNNGAFTTDNDLFFRCNKLTPERFESWLKLARWNFEADPRYKGFKLHE